MITFAGRKTVQIGEKMKTTRALLAGALAVACGVQMAGGASATAVPNPRPGNGAHAALDNSAAVPQITVQLSAEIKGRKKVRRAAEDAFSTWATALGRPEFFKFDATQADPNYPYGQNPGIRVALADYSVPHVVRAVPVKDPCTEYTAQCMPSSKGVRVRINVDRSRLPSLKRAVLARHLTREIGRALGLNYAKKPFKCELMLHPGEAVPTGCARRSAPTNAELNAVKQIYGLT